MLKEKYSKITFPVKKKDPESILRTYAEEFSLNSLETMDDISLIFNHALKDYLNDSLDEWAFGSLCFAIASKKKLRDLLQKENNILTRHLFDCVDISWLSEGKYFNEYKRDLISYIEELKKN